MEYSSIYFPVSKQADVNKSTFAANYTCMDKTAKPWFLLIMLACIWGSSFILMKRGLLVFSHTQVAALRISIAFLALVPVAWKYLIKIPKDKWLAMAVVGIVGNGIPAFLFTKAQTHIDSSLAGILNALVPLFTILIGFIFFNVRLKMLNYLGVFIGFIGATLLVNPFDVELGDQWVYALYVVLATLCYGISLNVIKHFLKDYSSVQITGTGFLFAAPFPLVYVFYSGVPEVLASADGAWLAFFYIAILAAVGTSLSVVMFNQLIKLTSPVFASSVTYLIPVIALMWGVIDGEGFNLVQMSALCLILGGIYLVNKK